jgi:hypothetical protein
LQVKELAMTTPKGGEYDTFRVKSSQAVVRPDGQMGLLLTTHEGRELVLGLDQQILDILLRQLASLKAAPKPPNKPNA